MSLVEGDSCATQLKIETTFRISPEENLEDHTTVFTDGSKSATGMGSAFVVEGAFPSWTLPKAESIYTVQLYSVW